MSQANNYIVTMQGINKAFPGVQALVDVDFHLKRGEIHALMGENGAGKSTLIKVLTGVEKSDSGTIILDGHEVTVRSPQHAQHLGISTVYQEVNLCPNLSLAENILLGQEPRILGSINWKKMNSQARNILRRLDVDIDVTRPLGTYSVAIQQLTAIARALEISAKVLILDEPTSSLDANETQLLFQVMRRLKDEGMAIIFVTHFIDQVFEVTDRITILRNGSLVGAFETTQITRMELVSNMIGRILSELDETSQIKAEALKVVSSEPLLTAEEFGLTGAIEPFDLELHAGEVLGLAGLLGSGRTEVAELLFGIHKPDQGSLEFGGKAVHDFSPFASINRGVALSPEDRKADGIVDDLTVRENIILAMQASRGWVNYLSMQQQYDIADKYIKLLNIATPSADQPVKNLSGGNQQKVILARWLAINPHILILDEPTRGIDVGAKAEIQKMVLLLAEEGKSCVFISSELDEVLRCSHRIMVLRDREKVAEFTGDVDEHTIMHSIGGSG